MLYVVYLHLIHNKFGQFTVNDCTLIIRLVVNPAYVYVATRLDYYIILGSVD